MRAFLLCWLAACGRIEFAEQFDAPALTYVDTVLADGPLLYFRFDAVSGVVVADSSASQLTGIAQAQVGIGAPGLLANDSVGLAVDLFGSPKDGNYVRVERTSVLEPASAVTIEALVRPRLAQGGLQPIVTYGESYQFFVANDDSLRGWIDQIGPLTSAPLVAVGSTYHVAMTYDQVTLTLYVGGAAVASTPMTRAFGYTGSDFLAVGGDFTANSGPSFNGVLDEVAIYGRALTPEQLAMHAAAATL